MSAVRFFSLVLLWLGIVYALAIAASLLYRPFADLRGIDTAQSEKSLFATETKYLMFSLGRLNYPGPRVIVLGASNAGTGLRPAMLASRLGMPVYNLSVGGSNAHEIGEVTDLALANIPANSWKQTIFVDGIWYGQFESDRRRWPDGQTDIDIEAARYHLYLLDGPAGHIEPRLPPLAMDLAALAMRPFLIGLKLYYSLDPVITDVRTWVLQLLGNKVRVLGESDTLVLTPAERKLAIDDLISRMGELGQWDRGGFDGLVAMAHDISAHGARLIILDLPLPDWHKRAIGYDAEYQRRMAALKMQLCAIPNVGVETLDGFSDDDFFDYVHPRPRVKEQWAQKTADLVAHGHGCVR